VYDAEKRIERAERYLQGTAFRSCDVTVFCFAAASIDTANADANPIESTFATVRHRRIRSKGCLSNKTALAMVFKLVEGAQKTWRRRDGHNQLPKIIRGVKFADGCEVIAKPRRPSIPNRRRLIPQAITKNRR
jgi:hypothetical protein